MKKPQYTSIPLDELKRIEGEALRTESVDDLRALFERLQVIRRTFIEDFDVQLAISKVQQTVVERGRVLVESHENFEQPAAFQESLRSDALQAVPSRVEAAEELPPYVEKIDARTWKRATYIGAFFAIILFALFFYLVLTARRLNMPPENTNTAPKNTKIVPAVDKNKPSAVPAPSTKPTLRLYTDLVPGTVILDAGEPQALQDGELQLDDLKPGRHTMKLTGRTGDATFEFESSEKGAPRLAAPPIGNDVMIVTASTEDGQGQLMTNAVNSQALLDNKDLGQTSTAGLPLSDLGQADHDLQIKGAADSQRFVLTYLAAPALTVFVKSDLNAGSLVVLAGEDNADVFIDNQQYRRQTEHGQLRIPTLKVGAHTVRISKQGFNDAPAQTVQIKKSEEARVVFRLQPKPQLATLEITGAPAGTEVLVDDAVLGTTSAEGTLTTNSIKQGEHRIELRREGFGAKQLQKTFQPGKTIALGPPDTLLNKAAQTAETPATPATAPPPSQPVAPEQKTPEQPAISTAVAEPATMPSAIHKGGGFLVYHATKAPGRYSFSMQLRKGGGFLKAKRLQWFLGYQNTRNYVDFQVDGKHFTVKQIVDGKTEELLKAPFEGDLDTYVQVDLAVKTNSVATRLRSGDGAWQNMGNVSVPGEDFTQGKFGVLISGNDEVGVSSVRYGK